MTYRRWPACAAFALTLWMSSPGASSPAVEERGPEDPHAASLRRGRAYSHLMRSLFAVRRGEVAAAVEEIHSAVELVPDSPDW